MYKKRIKSLIFILFFILSVAFGDAVCADGWYSYSSGRGTCSHHGGISNRPIPHYIDYTNPTETVTKPIIETVNNRSFLSIEGDQKVWRDSNGSVHRLDAPAIEGPNYKVYVIHGYLKREDSGPTYIIDNEIFYQEEWLVGGDWVPHRINGPAIKSHIKSSDETISIYADNGRVSRINKPAIIYYSSPNKYVEIFCIKGLCNTINIYNNQYVLNITFKENRYISSLNDRNDIIYAKCLDWSRSLTSVSEKLLLDDNFLRKIDNFKTFTDQYGITYTMHTQD
jgi:hypothetical protein